MQFCHQIDFEPSALGCSTNTWYGLILSVLRHSGCYFISLCKAAYRISGKDMTIYDVIDDFCHCVSKKYVDVDAYVLKPQKILRYLFKKHGHTVEVVDTIAYSISPCGDIVIGCFDMENYNHFTELDEDIFDGSNITLVPKSYRCFWLQY